MCVCVQIDEAKWVRWLQRSCYQAKDVKDNMGMHAFCQESITIGLFFPKKIALIYF